MSADEFNVHGLPGVIHCAHDTVVIPLNIKHNPVVAQKRSMAESIFDILRCGPFHLYTEVIPLIKIGLGRFVP